MTAMIDKRVGEQPCTGKALAEVWGDTVDLRHLTRALLIGVPVSAGTYGLASRILSATGAGEQVAHAWALLIGLAGCLLSGVLCALLFKPKRIVTEDELDTDARREVIEVLCGEPGGLGRVADLPPVVVAEMEQLGLRSAFEEAERRQEGIR